MANSWSATSRPRPSISATWMVSVCESIPPTSPACGVWFVMMVLPFDPMGRHRPDRDRQDIHQALHRPGSY
ncbi:hypothetical protein [Ornithinimicrobium kibberense]|uniref:hypothetical protein n=1 Tax=Ornithinimicrobium kibberense TaxID=282060 RepID=UPI00361BD06D